MQILSQARHQTALQAHERRRYQRYAVRCRCWLESESASLFAQTVDVGLGGLFLPTGVPQPEGSSVNVALENPYVPQRHKVVIITVIERPRQYVEVLPGFSTGEGFKLAALLHGRRE